MSHFLHLPNQLTKTGQTTARASGGVPDDGLTQAGSLIVPRFVFTHPNIFVDRGTNLMWVDEISTIIPGCANGCKYVPSQDNEGLWSAATEYARGVTVDSVDGLTTYVSLQDHNINHVVTDPAWWVVVTGADTGAIGGSFVYTELWQQCLVSCEGLVYGGFSDWRMPNVSEMDTLMSAEKTSPSWFTEIVPGDGSAAGTSSTTYWTSTTYKPTPTSAWTMLSTNSTGASTSKTAAAKMVKPVRSL